MPWATRKHTGKGDGYDIVKANTGKVVGHSDTKAKADASVRARYAAMEGKEIYKPNHTTKKYG